VTEVVAVKFILSLLASAPMFVRRFESEASAVASLRHSNIVQVYDFNEDARQLCALVANPNHSIIIESGNCMNLP
jgi:serine/threonine protein kinase